MTDRTERRGPRAKAAAPAAGPPPDGAFAAAKPRPADVRNAYRWILGREPEDSGVLARHAKAADSNATLRLRMLQSQEFRDRVMPPPPMACPADAPPLAIETTAPADAIAAMLERLRAGWTRLGETAPHHSCWPEPLFTPERIAATRRDFFATGLRDRALLEGVLARHRIVPGELGRLVDFGCGVGRATLHLAAVFPELSGVDISVPHLALARQQGRARGMDHIAWLRCRPDSPMPAAGCGLWFSRGVLQHCPPPLSRHLLELAFAALAPGGVAVFQLLTYGVGYAYAAGDAAAPTALHVLPQAEVFATAGRAGLAVLEVLPDAVPGLDGGRWVSHLFVARKPR